MAMSPDKTVQSLEDVLAADQWAREQANHLLVEFEQIQQIAGQE